MEEQPISKPILILAIIIILVITIGAIVLITNLITPKESKVQAFDDSIHNELIQNTLISRSEQAINDIVSSEHMPIQSAEEINSNILLKNMIVYLKDSNDRFYGQTFNYSSYGRFNAVIFGYDFNDYCVFCYYPNDWEAGPYFASAGDKTYATIKCNSDISNPDLPSLFIYIILAISFSTLLLIFPISFYFSIPFFSYIYFYYLYSYHYFFLFPLVFYCI